MSLACISCDFVSCVACQLQFLILLMLSRQCCLVANKQSLCDCVAHPSTPSALLQCTLVLHCLVVGSEISSKLARQHSPSGSLRRRLFTNSSSWIDSCPYAQALDVRALHGAIIRGSEHFTTWHVLPCMTAAALLSCQVDTKAIWSAAKACGRELELQLQGSSPALFLPEFVPWCNGACVGSSTSTGR